MKRLRKTAFTLIGLGLSLAAHAAEPIVSGGSVPTAIHDIPFEATFKKTLAAADAGNVEDQVQLGKFYEEALGVEQNLDEAYVWYLKAAEAGSATAALALGKLLQNEDLSADQRAEPELWLRRAAEMDLADAQVALARFLSSPSRHRQQEADEWMERAARQRNPVALAITGLRLVKSADAATQARGAEYLSDAGSQDQRLKFWIEMQEATSRTNGDVWWITDALHQAAMSLDLEQQYDVGQHWIASLAPGIALSGVGNVKVSDREKLTEGVKDNLKTAADGGDLQASCNLGFLSLTMRDFAPAFAWYHKAALRGSARAAYHLGVLYRDGLGVQPDPSSAVAWFYRAAIEMYPPAQAALGDMLLNGRGVTKDIPAAIAWLRPAAAYGNPLAQYDLGLAYDGGLGVEADRERALALIAKAGADWEFPAREGTGRKGLSAARDWLESAEADPQRRDAVRSAIAKAEKYNARSGLDTAPIDCLGRERIF